MSDFRKFVYKHGLITLLFVLMCFGLVTWVTYRVFGVNPPDVPLGTATAYATLFGLPAAAIGLWKWRNDKTDSK